MILGGLAAAIARLVLDWRATRRTIATIDSSDVLNAAGARIDGPLRARLRDESIRLLRCSWLIAASNVEVLPRCQELPDEAFFSGAEAEALLARGDRSVLVLSHGWQVTALPLLVSACVAQWRPTPVSLIPRCALPPARRRRRTRIRWARRWRWCAHTC